MPHLLIAEDSDLIAGALRLLFESHGYRVSSAETVADAAEVALGAHASDEPIDVLLLDLTLPDGHGLDLVALLRAQEALPPATIALTGHDDDVTRRRCLAAGCLRVLVKPVPMAELLAVVRAL